MESSFQMLQNGHLKCLVWNLYEELMNHQIFIKLFIKELFLGDNFKSQINFDWDIWNDILKLFWRATKWTLQTINLKFFWGNYEFLKFQNQNFALSNKSTTLLEVLP